MKVFLTGGTGLVGSHVAERLVREGHAVRALVRAGADDGFLRSLGVEICSGDVARAETLRPALLGCDALVHAAAIVVSGAPWEDYRRVNVTGTENVLSAAAEQGVGRAVHVSTVAVYGGAEVARRGRVDEDAPRDRPLPPGEFYARTKRQAEDVAWRFQREGRLQISVVRPDVIYGERDRVVIPRLARFLSSPLVFTIGLGRKQLPLVYAGNVAQGILLALTSDRAPGRAYNLADDFPITQREFFSLVAENLDLRRTFVPVPYAFAYGLAWGVEQLARLQHGGRPPVMSRRNVAFLGRGNPFVSERARTELGWEPEVGHEQGVRRAVGWYSSRARRC